MSKMKLYKRSPHKGFYVYSSCGCGDECAIRLDHVNGEDKVFGLAISSKEAIALGKLIIEVAEEYEKGIETGIIWEE